MFNISYCFMPGYEISCNWFGMPLAILISEVGMILIRRRFNNTP